MRKVVVTEFMTLDGVIESPSWSAPYWNDEIAQFKAEETLASDALLLGRVTYEMFASAWPQSKDEGAVFMNSVRKYVVTSTLNSLSWNNSVAIKSNVVEEIRQLKQQDGKNLLVYGSGKLVQTLIAHDLIDSYRFLIYPVVQGKGQRFISDAVQATLKLVESKTYSSGAIGLVYEPVRK